MNHRLAMALQQRAVDPGQRSYLHAVRHELIPFRERIEVAQALSQAQDHRLAALWYASALRYAGESRAVAVGYHLGNELRKARRERAAAQVLEEVCIAQPEWKDPAHSLAWLHRNAGRPMAAADVLERWLAAFSPTAEDCEAVAHFLLDMELADRAQAVLGRIRFPHPSMQIERSRLLQNLGRFGEAEKLLRAIVQSDPTQGEAWFRLAHMRRWESAEQSPLVALQGALRQHGIDDSTRAAITFALAKVSDDLEHYEQAWSYTLEANAFRRRSARFSWSSWHNYEKNIYQVFSKEFSNITADNASKRSPVFVVGMPRSGTTLLERRLGHHSRLQAAGELIVIPSLAVELVGRQNYPLGLASLPPAVFAGAGREWETRIPRGIKPGCEVIDKNPLNYMHLGFIFKILPNSRIIHCRRNPLDTALSLWFQNFAHPGSDYAYDMDNLACIFALYRRLMAWWEQVLPQRILTLDYETLVDRHEETLRRLVAELGLDWEDAVLEVGAEDDGAISTASLWQARQPVYDRSVGRRRNYEPWIAPLREALQREGIEA